MSIPLLDASRFTSSSNAERRQYVDDLLASLSTHGFVRLIGHGVPQGIVEEVFQWSQQFFALMSSVKSDIAHIPGPNPQRGYSCIGQEKTSTLYGRKMGFEVPEDLTDAREHFDQGSQSDDEFPNKWPEATEIPGYREFMEEYYKICEQESLRIMQALEEALELPTGTFTERIASDVNASELRLNHYPPISLSDMRKGNVNRIWPHFDLGVVTMLFVSDVGGLEVEDRTRRGSFIPIECESRYEMIVNISETLQRWTNEVLPAGLHQVTIPRAMKDKTEGIVPERFSVAYLCKAHRSALVGSLPQFKGVDSTEKYEDITALEYHQKRLLAAY